MPFSSHLAPSSSGGCNTILFDLDGTLVDSLPALTTCLNTILQEDGQSLLTNDAVRNMVGDGIRVLVQRAYTATGQSPSSEEDLNKYVKRFNAYYTPNPDVGCEVFKSAPEIVTGLIGLGYKVGLVTNKSEAPTRILLERLSLYGLFETIVCGDTTPHMKPHPEPLLHAADQLAVSPHNVIMVGDSVNDMDGAQRAGMRRIFAAYGYDNNLIENIESDAVIYSLMDLPQAIKKTSQNQQVRT